MSSEGNEVKYFLGSRVLPVGETRPGEVAEVFVREDGETLYTVNFGMETYSEHELRDAKPQ